MSDNHHESVLTLEAAAEFLHMHTVTLKRKARSGEIPASKPGKRWLFIEVDLVAYLRSHYSSRVMQGEHEKESICRSINVKTRPTGITKSAETVSKRRN
jgi:excisionase family DNA binding protein